MSVKERLVNGNVLQRDNTFVRIDLDHTVNQKKRVAMRKNPHDFGYSQFHTKRKEAQEAQKAQAICASCASCSFFLLLCGRCNRFRRSRGSRVDTPDDFGGNV